VLAGTGLLVVLGVICINREVDGAGPGVVTELEEQSEHLLHSLRCLHRCAMLVSLLSYFHNSVHRVGQSPKSAGGGVVPGTTGTGFVIIFGVIIFGVVDGLVVVVPGTMFSMFSMF